MVHDFRPSILSSFLTVPLLALVFTAVPVAYSQSINGGGSHGGSSGGGHLGAVPPSVTSLGFGGRIGGGVVPPSVTSLGFGRGNGPSRPGGHNGFFNSPGPRPHHRPYGSAYYPVWGGYYAYPILDYGDYSDQNDPGPADYADQDEYRGGPTIFDRRGDGQYPPPGTVSEPAPTQIAAAAPAPEPEEVSNQPKTVLVFRDGHQSEIDNYAIVGSTLYDLSGGQRHRISLDDLNLRATAQQNDDRGVDFQLPQSTSN